MNIQLLKQALNQSINAGLDPNNGVFGPKTTEAVKAFQRFSGLTPDGIVGPKTIEKLFPQKTNPTLLKPIPEWNGKATLAQYATLIAISQNGVRELTGKNDGEAVEIYLNCVNLYKGQAWCMAFVYWSFFRSWYDIDEKYPQSIKLLETGSCIAQWKHAEENRLNVMPFDSPRYGDIFIIDLGKGTGHTGIVTGVNDTHIFTIEGNTNTDGSSNGDGVYNRTRLRSKITGYIRV